MGRFAGIGQTLAAPGCLALCAGAAARVDQAARDHFRAAAGAPPCYASNAAPIIDTTRDWTIVMINPSTSRSKSLRPQKPAGHVSTERG